MTRTGRKGQSSKLSLQEKEKERLKSENDLKQYYHDLEAVLDTKPGMRVFQKLLKDCHLHEPADHHNSTIYNFEGQRTVAIHFWNIIRRHMPQHVPELTRYKERYSE